MLLSTADDCIGMWAHAARKRSVGDNVIQLPMTMGAFISCCSFGPNVHLMVTEVVY